MLKQCQLISQEALDELDEIPIYPLMREPQRDKISIRHNFFDPGDQHSRVYDSAPQWSCKHQSASSAPISYIPPESEQIGCKPLNSTQRKIQVVTNGFDHPYNRHYHSSQINPYNQPPASHSELQTRVSELVQQNQRLKMIIEQEYRPMQSMYFKLQQHEEQRDFLITQLQWKIRQLAIELKKRK